MKRTGTLLLLIAATVWSAPRQRAAEYVLVLKDEPVMRIARSHGALGGASARSQSARIRQAQSGVLAELQRRQVAVTGTAEVLVNAVMVWSTPEEAAELRKIPGVAYVRRAPELKLDLDRAIALQNVNAAWSAISGGAANAGAGIKIGIIDSGIDHNHPGFQDASLRPPAGFPKGETAYTNNKVIVARSYVRLVSKGQAKNPNDDSRPDDYTPRDRIGHGTAIAMIAAGVQNTGPAGTIQGIAPKAFLGNYKVAGSPGINPLTRFAAFNQALQDALADGMDIVTLALSEGNPAQYGPLDEEPDAATCGGLCDVFSQAVESAIAGGMVVVVSAGNSGNIGSRVETFTSIHTPGTAPSAITVGATTNSHVFYNTVRVPGFQDVRALFSDGPGVIAALTAPIRDAGGQACEPLAAGSLAGAIAMIERGTCSFTDKLIHAQNAGAIAAVFYQSQGQEILTRSLYVQNTGIPSMMIGNADGVALKNYLASSSRNVLATMDPALTSAETGADSVWVGSSRGPSPGSFANSQTWAVKPELVAVGANIYTAAQKLDPNGAAYHPSGYTSVTGTSYAVPMVAGAVALVKQRFPQMTPAQLKSAVVNTASQDVVDATGRARATSVGAGKLDAGRALTVTGTLDPPTIAFGVVRTPTVNISRTVRVFNHGNTTAIFNLRVEPRDLDAAASVTVTPAAVTVAPGSSQTVSVSLRGNRSNPGSYEGAIQVTGAGAQLRLPYTYLVGNGVPADIYPILNPSFTAGFDENDWRVIGSRVVDQYGVPVENIQFRYEAVSAGARILAADDQTWRLGIANARVLLGNPPGDKIFRARVGNLTLQFDGYARNYPDFKVADVKNAASFVTGQGFAPGSYISIFGTDLADATQVVSTPALPVSLSDVSVSFDADGVSEPGRLHFVNPGQVNVQIPWEFQGKASVAVKVMVGGLQSYVVNVPLAQYAPGIFEAGGVAAVQDVNYALVNQARPARRGEAIQIYVNGLGPVSNRPGSGELSPAVALAQTTATPTVTIGGVQAQVIFSGMTPNVVGLYQVNVIVPENAPSGNQTLTVAIGGVTSKGATLPVQ